MTGPDIAPSALAMTPAVNINAFMAQFHALERELSLFDSLADGQLWWDSVRFDICYYLYDCLTGLTYSSASRTQARRRRLGVWRRSLERQMLYIRSRFAGRKLLAIRAARNRIGERASDAVLDPLAGLFPGRVLTIDTLPRRYHLPDHDSSWRTETLPASLPAIIGALLDGLAIEGDRAAPLDALIRRRWAEYLTQVAGYRRLLVAARPRAVLAAGLDKALFHAAAERGIPAVEAQHGLIGYGHPSYSYPPGLDYGAQRGLPSLFLTFSTFWQANGHYPAGAKAVIGTDHLGLGIGPLANPLGAVMVISADIYNRELLTVTRQAAGLLPDRRFVYKLHPNQRRDFLAIAAAFADLANVTVGDPLLPASALMGGVSHLVAIQSTVVYEALQHDRRVCLLTRHDYHLHEDVFGLSNVTLTPTIDALVGALGKAPTPAGGGTFFDRFDAGAAVALLAPLIEGPPA